MNLFGPAVDSYLIILLAILCGLAIGYGLAIALREPEQALPKSEPEDPYSIHAEIDELIDEMQKRGW